MKLFSLFCVFVLLLNCCKSITSCNYIYHNATETAWATNVCIYNPAKSKYMKYECPLSTDTNQDTVYVSYYGDEGCSTQTERYDLVENINGAFSIGYDCSGYEGCYIHFMDNCDNDDESFHIYSPVDTCITKDDGTSFMFECDMDDFYHVSYNNDDCSFNLDDIVKSEPITSCKSTIIDTETKNWQFQACASAPTMAPSSPTVGPTDSSNPPTAYPTVTLPDFINNNKSIADLIEELGDKKSNSIITTNISIIAFIMLFVFHIFMN